MKAIITETDLSIIRSGLSEFIRVGHPTAVAKHGNRALELLRLFNAFSVDEELDQITVVSDKE